MLLEKLISAILIAYRITGLFVHDYGPANVMETIRLRAGVYRIGVDGRPETEIGRLLSCAHCTGFWVSLIVTLFLFPRRQVLSKWLVVAGGQSLLEALVSGK